MQLPTATELAVSAHELQRLADFWKKQRSIPTERVVCLNPGGEFGAAKHSANSQHFSSLARRIAVELNRTVLVLCGPAERGIATEIVRFADHPRVVSLAQEDLSLGLTKAAVQQASLLVTTDSGPRQFAPPFRVPSIVLYGPTHPAWSTTPSEIGESIQLKMDCGPCQQRTCPLKHHRCMHELTPDRVFAAVCRIVNGSLTSLNAA